MSTISSAELVRTFIEQVWNRPGGAAFASSFLADGYADHAYADNANGLRAAIQELHVAFSDAHFVIDDILVDGPKAAVRMHLHATHSGPFRGMAATQHSVDVKVFRWFRIADGRIAEHWALFDTAALLRQIQA